jgi:hypothetical protein
MRILVFIALVVIAGPTFASFRSGNKMHGHATSTLIPVDSRTQKQMQESFEFMEYVAGAIDSDVNLRRCLPSNVTLGQVADISAKYITTNDARRHLPAANLIRLAMIESFEPCKKLLQPN